MANQEHLDILKQGTETWNAWREDHPDIQPDLSNVDLSGSDFSRANFAEAYLVEADFSRTVLVEAIFSRAILTSVDFTEAILTGANLTSAYLINTDLSRADLRAADLRGADMREVNLDNVIFGRAITSFRSWPRDLREADLEGIDLGEADFNGGIIRRTTIGFTILGDVDLSTASGLDAIKHTMPSTVGIGTIIRSKGNIPTIFLKNIGMPDAIIEAIPSLIGSLTPIDFYSCFISYSSKDQDFANRLYADLQAKGVRCWFAPEDMKTGDVIRTRIDEAIRIYDKLLLVLSQHSVESSWVQKEVEAAFEKERQQKRHVLFPVRLDDVVMQTTTAWAADIRRMRHITDFADWKDHDAYQKAFTRLLRDLKAEV